jgi:hypothetical protein
MTETCAVDLRVHLPSEVAAEAAEVQRSNPEVLSRIVLYGLTRRFFYEALARRAEGQGFGHQKA